jgi:hypothetical protein
MSYPYRTPANEDRTTSNGIVVQRFRILSTQCVVYRAYERTIGGAFGSHQTVTTIDGEWYGTLHSRRDDSTYRHLAGGSDERIAAVRAHYNATDAEAYEAILAAFPDAASGKRNDGDIEIWH